MFQTIQLPAGVSNLDSCLANMDTETLSHDDIDKDAEDPGEVSACNVQYPTLD